MTVARVLGRRPAGPAPRLYLHLTLLLLVAVPVAAAPTSDCFPDRVASLVVGAVGAPPAFNTWQPGMVLGPPGDTTPINGSLSVVSLGRGGSIVLEFTDNEIVDRPGPDFIVFENPFFCTAVPQSAGEPYGVFAEPGYVAASEDGVTFVTFPYSAAALAQVVSLCSDDTLLDQLAGLAGITPSFTGDYTVPDDPLLFDPAAPGGVSGHGGDAFDLADVGLTRARFVRITDPDIGIGIPGASEGFDLDAVVAVHSLPLLGAAQPDADGDGLTDDAETLLYLTNPLDDDSDGDGTPDGEEAASCHDPAGPATAPFFIPALDILVVDPASTITHWNALAAGTTYDVIRGSLGTPSAGGGQIDLGVVTCIENDSTDLTTRNAPDAAVPLPGEGFFYLVRRTPASGGGDYGLSSAGEPRFPAAGGCP